MEKLIIWHGIEFYYIRFLNFIYLFFVILYFIIVFLFLQLRGLYSVWGVNYDAVIECMPPIISIFQSASMYFNGIFNTKKV